MMKGLVLALAMATGNAASVTIAGFVSASDVTAHSLIDLDIKAMDTCLDGTYDFTCATTMYTSGGNSVKSSGAIRTLQGFATSTLYSTKSEAVAKVYYDYWGTDSYADNFVSSALAGSSIGDANNNFAGLANVMRMQLAMKGTAYQALFRYVFHELESAISKATDGNLDNDSGAPHAWDEGWAFYAGSLEGTAVGGSSSGVACYRLAEKRCGNFGTCTGAAGQSKVNENLLTLYQAGLAMSQSGDTAGMTTKLNDILVQSTVPLVQGTLRYAYKCDPAALNAGDEACAEGYAFAAAVLPQVSSCDASAAATIKANMNLQLAAMLPDGFAAVKTALESVYDCMGITCADVGGLLSGTDTYYSGMEECGTLSPASHTAPALFAALLTIGVAFWR